MLINNNLIDNNRVEFISYTGKYPNLCSGILTLKINGEEVRFGHDFLTYDSWKTDGNYDSFWFTGGDCGFRNNYSESYINKGEWCINVDLLPDFYMKYAREIDDVFNENVPWGCCGGCL